MVKDRLVVNSASYTIETLNTLPDFLKPEKICERENDDTLIFWARDSVFSNFFQCEFRVSGVDYKCVEQYFCSQKADMFKDHTAYDEIMSESDPAKQKKIGSTVKGFNGQVWKTEMAKVMETGLKAKFEQNPELMNRLLDTNEKTIGEACMDPVWGTGFGINHPRALATEEWTGSNTLGNLLMKLREEFISR